MIKSAYRSVVELVLVLVYAVVLFGLSKLTTYADLGFLRMLLTVPFVLFLPGWALANVCFSHSKIDFFERLMLNLGLSLAIGVLGGLILNLLPWGLDLVAWLAYYSSIIVFCLILSRHYSPQNSLFLPIIRVMRNAGFRMQLLVSGIIFALSIIITLISINNKPSVNYTELWALPEASNKLEIGVVNNEMTVITYRIDLVVGDIVERSWPALELGPRATWQAEEVIDNTGDVKVYLYRNEQPESIYRQVHIRRSH